jgi:hypothetical protein
MNLNYFSVDPCLREAGLCNELFPVMELHGGSQRRYSVTQRIGMSCLKISREKYFQITVIILNLLIATIADSGGLSSPLNKP